MIFNFFLLVAYTLVPKPATAASTYDQKQTGELNVQVDLKNLHIIALMKGGKEEYVDYDYAYDYSEMTIKPQNGTTIKPLNVSSTTADPMISNVTLRTTVYEETTTDAIIKNTTMQIIDTTVVTEHPVVLELALTKQPIDEVASSTTKFSELIDTNTTSPVVNTGCKKGFVLNQKGGCEFKLQSASNALLKIIKLSQKLKRRENRKEPGNK